MTMILLLVVSINVIFGEFPGWNFLDEHDVQFLKRPAAGLSEAEESPDSCCGGKREPEVSRLPLEVQVGWVDELRS